MSLNARIERVDDPARLSAEGVAQNQGCSRRRPVRVASRAARRGPAGAQQRDLHLRLLGLSVAKCRIDDPQCDVSLPVAKKIVAKYASTP